MFSQYSYCSGSPVSKYALIPDFFDFKALRNPQTRETVKAVHI